MSIVPGHCSYKCNNLLVLKMGPALAKEGEFYQTASRTANRQCVEANGAGAGASNDKKQTNDGVI